jgi:4-hydroxy-tetrahydrodipicolinate synthase
MSVETLSAQRGVSVIAVTPFTEQGALDLDSTDRMVDFYLGTGATGLTILGMMGEASKLTPEESVTFLRRVIARAGRAPVIVGVSAPGFQAMADLSAAAMDAGALAVMVAPPPNLRSDEQIIGYYQAAADVIGADVPLVVQDYPLVTGVVFSPPCIGRIIETVPSVGMLKHEDWPGLGKIAALRAAERGGRRRISILCGNGGLFLPEELMRGADGAMTGFAFPEMMVGVCQLMEAGEPEAAQDLFDAYLPYARYEQQPNIGLSIRKHVLARRGVIESARARRPAPALSPDDIKEITRLLERQDRRLALIGRT